MASAESLGSQLHVPLSQSKPFLSFRQNVPLQRVTVGGERANVAPASHRGPLQRRPFGCCTHFQKVVEQSNREFIWRYYELGPRAVKSPLVFFPAAGGTAETFYKLIMTLGAEGYRVIAVCGRRAPGSRVATGGTEV